MGTSHPHRRSRSRLRSLHRGAVLPRRPRGDRSTDPRASDRGASAGRGARARRPTRRRDDHVKIQASPPPADNAGGRRPGVLRVLRTSLTSGSAYGGRPVSVGKGSPKCGRLPSRSRRCRVRLPCVVVPPIPVAGRPHRRGYCPFVRCSVKASIVGRSPERSRRCRRAICGSQAVSPILRGRMLGFLR